MITHINKRIYWPPRVLSLVFLIFMLMMSFDAFDPQFTRQEMLIGFLIHNISTLVVGIIVFISRKREIVGTYAFAGLGLLYMCFVARSAYQSGFERYLLAGTIQISGVLFLVSRLFWRNWLGRKHT